MSEQQYIHTGEAYKNFINTVDSEITKLQYRYAISYFMKFCKISEYDKLLNIEPKKLEGAIRDYIIHLKSDRKLSSNTINMYVAAVSHFYQMNDTILNWRKLSKFKGKKRLVVQDKPYTIEQILHLLEFADLRMKCIILLMSSAGLRRGAIPTLRYGDLERIEKHSLYKISIYKNEKEGYTSYCSPECAKILDQYFDWRERQGEILNETSPVIRKEFSSLDAPKPQPLSTSSIAWLVSELLEKSGVRPHSDNRLKRTAVMQCHGFRKFFETAAKNAGMDTLILKRLMGQKTGLEDSYYKPDDRQILEGNSRSLPLLKVLQPMGIRNYLIIWILFV